MARFPSNFPETEIAFDMSLVQDETGSTQGRGFSLTARLTGLVLIVVACALSLFVVFSTIRLEQSAQAQRDAVNGLVWERVATQMRLQSQLVKALFDQKQQETRTAVSALAQRRETADVLQRGNIVAIDMLLKNETESSVLSGAVAFDASLNALGSHKPGLSLLDANTALARSSLAAIARGIIGGSDRRLPQQHTRYFAKDSNYVEAMGLDGEGLLIVSLHPVFDDFGDVIALIVGHRIIPASDNAAATDNGMTFSRLARTEKLGIHVFDGADNALFHIGGGHSGGMQSNRGAYGNLTQTDDQRDLFICNIFQGDWRYCISEPRSFLTGFADPLNSFIRAEKRSLTLWNIASALIAILAATVAAFGLTRRLLSPLRQITRAVRSVARGNWLAHVSGRRRRDEVGDISRAVVVLQRSMKEREKLRADVADIDTVRARQVAVEAMTRQCHATVRKHMFNISDMGDDMMMSSDRIESLIQLAVGEADEARLIAQRAEGPRSNGSSLVVDAIDRLAETVAAVSIEKETLSRDVEGLTKEAGRLDRDVKEILGDLVAKKELPLPPAKSAQPWPEDAI